MKVFENDRLDNIETFWIPSIINSGLEAFGGLKALPSYITQQLDMQARVVRAVRQQKWARCKVFVGVYFGSVLYGIQLFSITIQVQRADEALGTEIVADEAADVEK